MMRLFVRHQFFFDIGSGVTSKLLSIGNTVLLLAALAGRERISTRWPLLLVIVASYLTTTWALGKLLDKHGYLDHLASEGNRRNAALRHLEDQGRKPIWAKPTMEKRDMDLRPGTVYLPDEHTSGI